MVRRVRKVLLVDDHPVVRQGIARILAAEIHGLALAEAVDGPSALDELRERPPHLILLDLSMPGENGLSLPRRIRREFPSIPVMIVSMHPADQFEATGPIPLTMTRQLTSARVVCALLGCRVTWCKWCRPM